MTPRTRVPTGVPPYPLVLVEGPEKSGKSWAAAQFTASEKIGQAYWLDWGEGAADEYAAIPGAKYLVLEHDGSWQDILAQVDAVYQEAENVPDGEPPVVLVIDSLTTEWEQLKDWISNRAKESPFARRKLKDDPNAEIKPSMNLWNDAAERHSQLMRRLMRFPGICIVTARGKETVAVGDDGKPIEKAKDYRVEGHKTLAYDASVWIRLSRDDQPQVIGCRSVKAGIQPGVDKPLKRPDLTLEHVIFDVLGLDVKQSKARQVTDLVSDEKSLADAARADLGQFIREFNEKNPNARISYRAQSERFHAEHGETLEETRDPQAVRNLLDELRLDQQAAVAS